MKLTAKQRKELSNEIGKHFICRYLMEQGAKIEWSFKYGTFIGNQLTGFWVKVYTTDDNGYTLNVSDTNMEPLISIENIRKPR